MTRVVFRADGDSTTGLGHIMRSAALLQILQPHFHCSFFTQNADFFPVTDFTEVPELVELPKGISNNEEASLLKEYLSPHTIMVLDGYKFTTDYQTIVKKDGVKLVCIDDIFSYHFVADAIINHAGGVSVTDYSCEPYTKLFLGPQFSLIKPVFFDNRPTRNLKDKSVLISFGGADPDNATEYVLQKVLADRKFDSLHVVIGAANKSVSALREKFGGYDGVQFHQNISGSEMSRLMRSCTYAILPPSTVCYEYMSTGGITFLHVIADNQKRLGQYLLDEKLAFPFADMQFHKEEELQLSLLMQSKIFDGSSQANLLNLFKKLDQWN